MDTERIALRALTFTLYRVNPDESRDLVSEHPDFGSGWSVGTHAVTVEDKENAYSLYVGTRLVAGFGHARLMTRFGAERVALMLGSLA